MVVVGVVGIIVYSEMCGRVAAVSEKAVFDAVRERAGFGAGLTTLIAAQVVNLMTLAAEVGGVAICLRLLSGLPYRWLVLAAIVAIGLVVWVVSFEWIERIFGYGGLCLLVFAVAVVQLHPDWGAVAHGFVPHVDTDDTLLYLYFAVGLLGAAMTPYEVYFYSSGGVEEGWTPKDLGINRANAVIGYGLGGFLSFTLMITGGALFLGQGIDPEFLGTIAHGRPGSARPGRPPPRALRHPLRRRRSLDRHPLRRRLQPRPVHGLGMGRATARRQAHRASRSAGSCSSCSLSGSS